MAKAEQDKLENFIELLVEIAALQRLQIHWSEEQADGSTLAAKKEVVAGLLRRKVSHRDNLLQEFKTHFPDIEQFSWGNFSELDA